MATSVLIPISEYLNTTYHPDCDYVDGKLKERNVGEKPHGLLQSILSTIFMANRRSWGLVPIVEQRVQTSETHFRIPDFCAIRPIAGEYIVQSPPVLCVEILSKGDSLTGIQERIDDYLGMGVENIWVFDPLKHIVYLATRRGFERVSGVLTIPDTSVQVNLGEVFQDLDDLLAGRL